MTPPGVLHGTACTEQSFCRCSTQGVPRELITFENAVQCLRETVMSVTFLLMSIVLTCLERSLRAD